MGKAPAFQLYAADFYMDTVDWTPTQVGVYMRLLMSEWINGPLPDKIGNLARIGGVDSRNMQKMWSAVLAKKFTTDGAGLLINKRLEEVRLEQAKYRESQSEKGKRGAEIRWEKPIAGAMPVPIPKDSSSSSPSVSSLKKKKLYSLTSDEVRLASLLHGKILENDSKTKKPNIQKWAHDINLLIRVDGRKVQEVERVIEWCRQDSFWMGNILSAGKLRKQFAMLLAQMNRKPKYGVVDDF